MRMKNNSFLLEFFWKEWRKKRNKPPRRPQPGCPGQGGPQAQQDKDGVGNNQPLVFFCPVENKGHAQEDKNKEERPQAVGVSGEGRRPGRVERKNTGRWRQTPTSQWRPKESGMAKVKKELLIFYVNPAGSDPVTAIKTRPVVKGSAFWGWVPKSALK